jgi:hypothetical protein
MNPANAATLKTRGRVRAVATLGIRFWDPALDSQVADGLNVTAFPEQMPGQRLAACRTHSGIYAFRGLPGLRSVEYPAADDSLSSPPVSRRFFIEVSDRDGRFLPALFGVEAPFSGVFPNAVPTVSPPTGPPGFYPPSAAGRTAPSNLAVIRAQLEDAALGGAARYAVLEILHNGSLLQVGVADERGSVAVFMPYPAFADPSLSATPTSPAAVTLRQSWDLSFRVRYQPASLQWPTGPMPELRSIFAQSPASFLMPSGGMPNVPVPELAAELVFGRELVLRTGPDARLFLAPPSTSP